MEQAAAGNGRSMMPTAVDVSLVGTSSPKVSRARARGLLGIVPINGDVSVSNDRIIIDGQPAVSAAGITLDAGRELLAHSAMVNVRRAVRRSDGSIAVDFVIDMDSLRDRLRQERQGPVAAVLGSLTTLSGSATLRHGQLAAVDVQLRAVARDGGGVSSGWLRERHDTVARR